MAPGRFDAHGTICLMRLEVTATLWLLFSAWLCFPHLGVAPMLRSAAALLMWLEFACILVWAFGSENCVQRPCGAPAESARTAATIDVPALGVVVLALVVADGIRRHRAPSKAARPRIDVG